MLLHYFLFMQHILVLTKTPIKFFKRIHFGKCIFQLSNKRIRKLLFSRIHCRRRILRRGKISRYILNILLLGKVCFVNTYILYIILFTDLFVHIHDKKSLFKGVNTKWTMVSDILPKVGGLFGTPVLTSKKSFQQSYNISHFILLCSSSKK